MNKKVYNSAIFRKKFLSYTAIIIIPILLFSTIYLRKVVKDKQTQVYNNYLADSERITRIIDEELIGLKYASESLRKKDWINRLMADDGIYANEFDVIKTMHIKEELFNIMGQSSIPVIK